MTAVNNSAGSNNNHFLTLLRLRLMEGWIDSREGIKRLRLVSSDVKDSVDNLFWRKLVVELPQLGKPKDTPILKISPASAHSVHHLTVHQPATCNEISPVMLQKAGDRLCEFLKLATNLRSLDTQDVVFPPSITRSILQSINPSVEAFMNRLFERRDSGVEEFWGAVSLPSADKEVSESKPERAETPVKHLFPGLNHASVLVVNGLTDSEFSSLPDVLNLDLRLSPKESVQMDALDRVLRAVPSARRLTLDIGTREVLGASDDINSSAAPSFPNISSLTINGRFYEWELYDTTLDTLLSRFPNLTHLSFHSKNSITTELATTISQRLKTLRNLEVFPIKSISCLQPILHLRRLSLDYGTLTFKLNHDSMHWSDMPEEWRHSLESVTFKHQVIYRNLGFLAAENIWNIAEREAKEIANILVSEPGLFPRLQKLNVVDSRLGIVTRVFGLDCNGNSKPFQMEHRRLV